MWTVPGGGMEVDDYIKTPKTNSDCWYFALENTLKREVREEVGLEIKKANYLLDLAFIRSKEKLNKFSKNSEFCLYSFAIRV